MVKLDLKDAYFTVPVWKGHQKFLRFVWKETLWEFACLPFGLASAPENSPKSWNPFWQLFGAWGFVLLYIWTTFSFRADCQTPPGNSYESPRKLGVSFSTSAENRILGSVCGLSNPVSCPPSRQSQEYSQGVRRPDRQSSRNSAAISPSLGSAELL